MCFALHKLGQWWPEYALDPWQNSNKNGRDVRDWYAPSCLSNCNRHTLKSVRVPCATCALLTEALSNVFTFSIQHSFVFLTSIRESDWHLVYIIVCCFSSLVIFILSLLKLFARSHFSSFSFCWNFTCTKLELVRDFNVHRRVQGHFCLR